MKRLALYLTGVIILFSVACKKDDRSSQSKASLLTASKWLLRKTEYQRKDGTWFETSLEGDGVSIEFHEDKSVIAINGRQSVVGAWIASNDFSQITISGTTGSANSFDILVLNSSTMQLSPKSFSSTIYLSERDTFSH